MAASSPSSLYEAIVNMAKEKAKKVKRTTAIMEDKLSNANRPEYIEIFDRVFEDCTVAGRSRILAAADKNYTTVNIYKGADLGNVHLAPHYYKIFVSNLLAHIKTSLGQEFSITYNESFKVHDDKDDWCVTITATWRAPP